jgi:hypothetical protein
MLFDNCHRLHSMNKIRGQLSIVNQKRAKDVTVKACFMALFMGLKNVN